MFLKDMEVGKPTSYRKFTIIHDKNIPKQDKTESIIIIMYHKKTRLYGNPEDRKLFSDAITDLL
jgi:hypothetical protein